MMRSQGTILARTPHDTASTREGFVRRHRTAAELVPIAARGGGAARITLKSEREIAAIGRTGRLVHKALEAAAAACRPGATTAEVDAAAAEVIARGGGRSVLRGYAGSGRGQAFPADTCVSVNEQVIHGVPGSRALSTGDLVTIDCGVQLEGWCCDAAVTVGVGAVSPEASQLVQSTELVLATAIHMIRPGVRWSEIAVAMHCIGAESGFGVVTGYVGHGIGRRLHEPPQIPAFLDRRLLRQGDFTLCPGMTLAIEPILALGSGRTRKLPDGWTVVTEDGEVACHVEHTVAVTRDRAVVLSRAD